MILYQDNAEQVAYIVKPVKRPSDAIRTFTPSKRPRLDSSPHPKSGSPHGTKKAAAPYSNVRFVHVSLNACLIFDHLVVSRVQVSADRLRSVQIHRRKVCSLLQERRALHKADPTTAYRTRLRDSQCKPRRAPTVAQGNSALKTPQSSKFSKEDDVGTSIHVISCSADNGRRSQSRLSADAEAIADQSVPDPALDVPAASLYSRGERGSLVNGFGQSSSRGALEYEDGSDSESIKPNRISRGFQAINKVAVDVTRPLRNGTSADQAPSTSNGFSSARQEVQSGIRATLAVQENTEDYLRLELSKKCAEIDDLNARMANYTRETETYTVKSEQVEMLKTRLAKGELEILAQDQTIAALRQELSQFTQRLIDREEALRLRAEEFQKLQRDNSRQGDDMAELRRRLIDSDADTLRMELKLSELSTQFKAQSTALAQARENEGILSSLEHTRSVLDLKQLAGNLAPNRNADAESIALAAIIDSKDATIVTKDALIEELRASKIELKEYVEEYKMQLRRTRANVSSPIMDGVRYQSTTSDAQKNAFPPIQHDCSAMLVRTESPLQLNEQLISVGVVEQGPVMMARSGHNQMPRPRSSGLNIPDSKFAISRA